MIAKVMAANKNAMEETNNNLISCVDGFLQDAMSNMSNISSMTSMFNKLGGIKGSLTSALSFENIKMNVFPGELKPNEAVSDFYTLCSGGGAASQTALPSTNAVDKATGKHLGKLLEKGKGYIDEIAPRVAQVAFSEPTANTPSIDLTKIGAVESDLMAKAEEIKDALDLA